MHRIVRLHTADNVIIRRRRCRRYIMRGGY